MTEKNCSWNTQHSSACYTSRSEARKRTKVAQFQWPKARWKVLLSVWHLFEMIKELSKSTFEVPSKLRVSILGQIKGNATLYSWILNSKSGLYWLVGNRFMIIYWKLRCLKYGGQPEPLFVLLFVCIKLIIWEKICSNIKFFWVVTWAIASQSLFISVPAFFALLNFWHLSLLVYHMQLQSLISLSENNSKNTCHPSWRAHLFSHLP